MEVRIVNKMVNEFYLSSKEFSDDEKENFFYCQEKYTDVEISRIRSADFVYKVSAEFAYCDEVFNVIEKIRVSDSCEFELVQRGEGCQKRTLLKGRIDKCKVISGEVIEAEFLCKEIKSN